MSHIREQRRESAALPLSQLFFKNVTVDHRRQNPLQWDLPSSLHCGILHFPRSRADAFAGGLRASQAPLAVQEQAWRQEGSAAWCCWPSGCWRPWLCSWSPWLNPSVVLSSTCMELWLLTPRPALTSAGTCTDLLVWQFVLCVSWAWVGGQVHAVTGSELGFCLIPVAWAEESCCSSGARWQQSSSENWWGSSSDAYLNYLISHEWPMGSCKYL